MFMAKIVRVCNIYFPFLQLDTREIQKKSALHSLHRLLGLFAMMKQINGNVVARYKMCQVDFIRI